MRLIYLVKGEPSQLAASLAEGSVSCAVAQFGRPDQDFWLLSYSTESNSAKEAKALSAIASSFDSLGIDHLLLDDGASTYFERRLFDEIAGFERKLRAALSMRVALQGGELKSQLVKDLEEIDFGTLFERFFVDDDFVDGYRKILGKGGPKYEKADLLAEIKALPEAGKWDGLFNDNEAPTVKAYHGFVREVRNDVMHAHRMSTDRFNKAKRVLSACNEELDALLEDLPGETGQPDMFAEALTNVLGERPFEPTWENLRSATWEDLVGLAYRVGLADAFQRATSSPARESAE